MARSTYIYVVVSQWDDPTSARVNPPPIGAFTVKHEMLSSLDSGGYDMQTVEVWRFRDGMMSDGENITSQFR